MIPVRNQAQADMAVAIERMCPALDARSGALGPREPTRTAAEDELNITCANIVFNDGLPGGGPDLDDDDDPDVPGLQLPEATLAGVVQQLNGEELQAAQQRIGEIRDVQTANIAARLTALRTGLTGPGISLAGLDVGTGGESLALADLGAYQIVPAQWEGDLLSRLGLFASGTVKFGDKDATGTSEGFDFTTTGVTVGGDWRFTDALIGGLAVGYSHFDTDFDTTINSPPGQDLKSDGVTLSLFGTYFPTDQIFFDAVASVGWSFYDSRRRVLITDSPTFPDIDARMSGDFDAFHYGFAANAGYEMTYQGVNVTPIVRLEYLRAEIDGYTEDTDSALGLTFSDTDAESLTTNVGVELNYPISTGIGVFTPLARAEYVHEFLNDQSGVRVHYADDPTVGPDGRPLSSFVISTDEVDRDYGIVGAGVAATFPAGWAAFVDYSAVVGLRDFSIHTVNLGVRKSF